MSIKMGDVVWQPQPDALTTTQVGHFLAWLRSERGVELVDHESLWKWSVSDLSGFWSAVWEFFSVTDHGTHSAALQDRVMPGTRWFPDSLLNYADEALRAAGAADDEIAVYARSQARPDFQLSFGQLRDQVARARRVLSDLGVRPGDRVAGYLPNCPEALVAFLAAAGLGAVWTSCAIEFGPRSVVDRLGQVEPRVLFVAGGYQYGRKAVDRSAEVAQVVTQLPSAQTVIDIEYGEWRVPDALSWGQALNEATDPITRTVPVAFDHPLVVLFSSGTTGKPKAIVHGHGGITLEHFKNHALSWDLGRGDVLLWYSTTAWMMWNALVSALLVGSSIVMIDGDPAYPDLGWQWRLAHETGATMMGASPGFLMACRSAGVEPGDGLSVRVLGSAGAPLPPEAYGWVRDHLGDRVQVNVGSGGTDVCSGLVQNNPLLPVRAGMISGRALAVDVHAFDEQGQEVLGVPGELVVTAPMPSMPVGLWGDTDGSRLAATYFDTYPGVWRHGDWIIFEADGSCVVTGRSDATLNRGGVRLGTAEFYRVVEELPEINDSMVVHLEDSAGGNGRLMLFVTLTEGELTEDLSRTIRSALRGALSPRHVPDDILAVPAIPRNLTGKKLEVPVKRILQGHPADSVVSRDALAEPEALTPFVAVAAQGLA